MKFLKLYEEENRDLLYSLSWLNKNIGFDKSVGSFNNIDLFSFLENVSLFDYEKDIFYDDIYYIIEYTKDSILHIINNINREIKRAHKIIPISQAKEFDSKTALWISKQSGITIKDKLKNNRIKAVKRYSNIDTYENRIFKNFLKKLILIEEKREKIQRNDYLISKIRQWLRSDDAKSINEYGNIVYNNILLHHPYYSKIFKSYKWLNRLDEKIDKYIELFQQKQQIITILKFDILSKLQFKTDKLILPSNIEINRDKFDIKFNKNWLVKNIDLEQNVFKLNLKVKSIGEINFLNIQNMSKKIENNFNFRFNLNRLFSINLEDNNIFIDLFRLFPVAFADNRIIQFPITLKQKINNNIVNANNTKIIDLNNEFYTLPEIFKTYDIKILKYFIKDLERYFKDKRLSYIIPDYVNIFDFSKVKKTINSYFSKNKVVPKSVLAGLKYIFDNKVSVNDTLIYIQKDFNNVLYITPLLVKYDETLNSITNGLYLEKHPSKKLKEEDDLLQELNQYFNPQVSRKILSKCLQNGIKNIKEKQIAFYLNDEIIYLKNVKNLSNRKDFSRIKTIKELFPSKKLFQQKAIEINDTNEENLKQYQKLIDYEAKGYILWKEHLPKLTMGDMPMEGYFGEFILVDDDSEVINGEIEVREHFIIPANAKELSFPLIFGDENINYEAYITSNNLPLKEPVECQLQLKYNYEAETPYKLTFIALNNDIKPLKVTWREIQDKEYNELPIPSYPPKKSWDELVRFKNKNNEEINLLEWVSKDFKRIIEINNYLQNDDREEAVLSNFWEKDSNGKEFQEIDTNFGTIRIYKNRHIEKANKITFIIEQRGRYYRPINIVSDQEHMNLIKSIRFPLYTIWKDGNSLNDLNVPNEFRSIAYEAIGSSIELLENAKTDPNLKKELFLFLSIINKDAPKDILKTYIKFIQENNNEKIKEFRQIIPYSISCLDTEFQKKLFNEILKLLIRNDEKIYSNSLKMLGIILWRCENVLFKIDRKYIDLILNRLLNSLIIKIKSDRELIKNKSIKSSVINRLELLLAILRYRAYEQILKPEENITKEYIKIIDIISKKVIKNKLKFKSRIQLNLVKPNNFSHTPDLLYALRIYLSGNSDLTNNIQILGVSDD